MRAKARAKSLLMNNRLTYILLTLGLLLLTSCNHKELYIENFDQYQVRVEFNFEQTSDVPTTMRVVFYPIGELAWHQPWLFDVNATGGYVQLPAGDYRVLAYNVDAMNIIEYERENYDNFSLSTSRYEIEVKEDEANASKRRSYRRLFGSYVPVGEGEVVSYPLYDSPDWTCTCRQETFHLEPQYGTIDDYKNEQTHETSKDIRTLLTLTAEDAVKHLEFELTGIEGAKWASVVRGTISGIPTSYNMASGQPSGELGLMTFAARVDEDNEAIVGTMNVWGFYPTDDSDAHQYLNIYIWAQNGNHYVSQDVTVQMEGGQDSNTQRLVIHLNSQGIDLNDDGNGDSGFKPSVGTWEEQSTNIKL